MEIKWEKSESTEYPAELDTGSSPNTIYVRRNIIEVERTGDGEEPVSFYEYDEAKMTPAEFTIYASQINSENILAIMEALTEIGG
ncbi:MAG: hypothetical protein IKE28_11815 [Solobacterium sp.]|nr:hypothetical protein [Solobacterium sp.]